MSATDRITRDDARAYFASKGMRYTQDPSEFMAYPIHWGDIVRLWCMCEEHIGEAELEMHMRPKPKIKRIRGRDQVREAYLRVDGPYFTNREAISFNGDGDMFIGFAGWASDKNVRPFLSAFIEWVDWFVGQYGERAVVPASMVLRGGANVPQGNPAQAVRPAGETPATNKN